MIGEIIETTTLDFLAESMTLHRPPPLGETVKVNIEGELFCYGVVSHGSTSSPDAGRRAVRRSGDGVVDEEVYRQHPQLERLLQTVFRVQLVGYRDAERIRRTLPPSPPPLHHAVHGCEVAELVALSERLDYFGLILGGRSETPAEQVLAAHIRRVAAAREDGPHWLERAARECAMLLKSDHERLLALLVAIDPS